MSSIVAASTIATLDSAVASHAASPSASAISAPGSSSPGRLVRTGSRTSVPISLSATGTPLTNTTPPTQVRPTRGYEGISTTRRPTSTSADSSDGQLPRSVESILCTRWASVVAAMIRLTRLIRRDVPRAQIADHTVAE